MGRMRYVTTTSKPWNLQSLTCVATSPVSLAISAGDPGVAAAAVGAAEGVAAAVGGGEASAAFTASWAKASCFFKSNSLVTSAVTVAFSAFATLSSRTLLPW